MYNREKAVAYAHRWAYGFNPAYGNFTDMGGDCTNFLSQCLHAGGLPMNYRPVTGWFYNSLSSRAPAWTGVQPFFNFMTGLQGGRPYAAVVSLEEIEPGDVLEVGSPLSEATVLGATHTENSDYRPLSHWQGAVYRCLHILE